MSCPHAAAGLISAAPSAPAVEFLEFQLKVGVMRQHLEPPQTGVCRRLGWVSHTASLPTVTCRKGESPRGALGVSPSPQQGSLCGWQNFGGVKPKRRTRESTLESSQTVERICSEANQEQRDRPPSPSSLLLSQNDLGVHPSHVMGGKRTRKLR